METKDSIKMLLNPFSKKSQVSMFDDIKQANP